MNKLVKARITFTTDIVAEVLSDAKGYEVVQSVHDIWEQNSDSIIAQTNNPAIITIDNVESLDDLPLDWEAGSYPWTAFKHKRGEEKRIKDFFKKECYETN